MFNQCVNSTRKQHYSFCRNPSANLQTKVKTWKSLSVVYRALSSSSLVPQCRALVIQHKYITLHTERTQSHSQTASPKPTDKELGTLAVDHDYFLCVNFKIVMIFFYVKCTNNEVKQCQVRWENPKSLQTIEMWCALLSTVLLSTD